MEVIHAHVTLNSFAPYSQSRYHETPKLTKESDSAYDARTWREHLHTSKDGMVLIPEHGLHQCIVSAAAYAKKKIKGQGNSTWTAKFRAGIALMEPIVTDVKSKDVGYIDIFANADGVRGSGKRVMRRYPEIPKWSTHTTITILDPIITEDIFMEIMDIAGKFVGIGRFRPEKGGQNGRFTTTLAAWEDGRLSGT